MGRPLYFAAVVSILFLSFSSSNLSDRRLDVYHISVHDVALMRILNVCLKCAARGSRKNTECKNYAKNRHLSTIAQLCRAISSQLRHVLTIGKNLLNGSISFTYTHNMVNFGLLMAEIGWGVWGTTANFNGFRVLASLLHRRRSTEVNQTLHDVWRLLG